MRRRLGGSPPTGARVPSPFCVPSPAQPCAPPKAAQRRDVLQPSLARSHFGSYQLGVSLHTCPGAFGRSKMLTVAPRVVLSNALPTHAIAYKQADLPSSGGGVIFPTDTAPFHFRALAGAAASAVGAEVGSGDGFERRLLSIALLPQAVDRADDFGAALANCDWSMVIPIGDVGEFNVVCRSPDPKSRGERLFLCVDVQVKGAETTVSFTVLQPSLAPYRIDNHTSHSILISQSPCAMLEHPRIVDEVEPGGRRPFAWEQVTEVPTLDVHIANVRAGGICLDDLQLERTIHLPASGEIVRYRTAADGPIKVLQLLPVRDGVLPRSLPGTLSASHADDGRVRSMLTVAVASLGLSLVDDEPKEIVPHAMARTHVPTPSGPCTRPLFPRTSCR